MGWARCLSVTLLAGLGCWAQAVAQSPMDHKQHQHHQMTMSPAGMVMYSNTDTLPRGCAEISRDYEITVTAGKRFAKDIPGAIFGMSQHEIQVDPCSRVTLTFINEDEVRHQWMVHGLPKYLYPQGMVHIEAMGGRQMTGTFIVPADDRTYLIHCDMAQHMEKGMKGQLVVGKGSGDLWNIAGVSDSFDRALYLPPWSSLLIGLILLLGFLSVFWLRK